MPDKPEKESALKEKWLRFSICTPPELVDALSNYLTENGAQGVFEEYLEPDYAGDLPADERDVLNAFFTPDFADHYIAGLSAYIESLAELFPHLEKPTFKTEMITNPGWDESWKKYFKPLRISKNIVVKPTWERYASSGRDVVIDIDPGMAFGTGQHPSTRMCLEALEEILLKDRSIKNWRVLDVGTGTGILGIAAAKLGAESVLCADIDSQAVDIAHKNVAINRVADHVVIINSDVRRIKGTFDLIVANLTADTLITIKPHLMKLLGKDGYLVISGIVEPNREALEKEFFKDGLPPHKVLDDKEWLCYVIRKSRKAAG